MRQIDSLSLPHRRLHTVSGAGVHLTNDVVVIAEAGAYVGHAGCW